MGLTVPYLLVLCSGPQLELAKAIRLLLEGGDSSSYAVIYFVSFSAGVVKKYYTTTLYMKVRRGSVSQKITMGSRGTKDKLPTGKPRFRIRSSVRQEGKTQNGKTHPHEPAHPPL